MHCEHRESTCRVHIGKAAPELNPEPQKAKRSLTELGWSFLYFGKLQDFAQAELDIMGRLRRCGMEVVFSQSILTASLIFIKIEAF